jgi:hypothetical protein
MDKQPPKSHQLQIRVSRLEKAAIQRAAIRAGLDMSSYVLGRVLSAPANEFQALAKACVTSESPRFALASFNTLLSSLTPGELREATAVPLPSGLSPFLQNYIAAMVEYACGRRAMAAPSWTSAVAPLAEPMFATELQSLRLHLLTHSPPPFRLRNIFIDTSLGGQV